MTVCTPPGFETPYILNAYKDSTQLLCCRKGWITPSVEKVWMLFIEEVGELAGSIRRVKKYFCDKKKASIEDELGDVFSYLFQLAFMLDIDLDVMWQKHQTKAYNKQYLDVTFELIIQQNHI